MRTTIAVLLASGLAFSFNACAADNTSEWVQLTGTKNNSSTNLFLGKKGSFRHMKGQSSFLLQQIRTTIADDRKEVRYYQVAISDKACDNGYGKLYFNDVEGKPDFDADYIAKGESAGSAIGDALCAIKAMPDN
ncbi:hypothetical protein [Kluyvera chengduensis]|uniref:hypothetical protein n=1 Tax=Kluyvera sp. 142359 TaxID=3375726 RepID=UPI00377363D7